MNLEFDLSLSDFDFLSALRARIRETGEVADVFPDMVAFNVPLFALRELWPQEYRFLLESRQFPAFCVAEHGWRGRIDNVHSSLETDGVTVKFEKSYVMECEVLYVVVRAEDGIALCRVPRSPLQTWTSRADDSVRFKSSKGRIVDHYIVSSVEKLAPAQLCIVSRRQYTAVGIAIPRREITGLAVLAQGLMEHRGLGADTAQKTQEILLDRKEGPTKQGVRLAGEVFAEFQRLILPETRHPFWNRAAEFFARG